MRLRFERLLILTPLLLGLLSGCGAGANDKLHLEQKTFSRRSFLPELKGRWIGSAICYGPHRDGQRPGGPSPSAIEIRQDLQLMLPHWNLLRIYGSSEIAETLLEEIKNEKLAMKVMLGAWIAPEADAANRQEIDAAIRLANAYPEIVLAVSVGNETLVSWSGHRSPLDRLIDYVRHVRSNVAVPVTVADDFNFWNKPESRALAGEIDFITMHAHPMWNGVQLEDASKWLREQAAAIEAMHSDLDIVIGETGWATSVHDEGDCSWDSIAFVDNFKWSTEPVVPGTFPVE